MIKKYQKPLCNKAYTKCISSHSPDQLHFFTCQRSRVKDNLYAGAAGRDRGYLPTRNPTKIFLCSIFIGEHGQHSSVQFSNFPVWTICGHIDSLETKYKLNWWGTENLTAPSLSKGRQVMQSYNTYPSLTHDDVESTSKL